MLLAHSSGVQLVSSSAPARSSSVQVPSSSAPTPSKTCADAAQSKPDIMDHFRMPYGVGDAVLVAKAQAIADAAAGLTSDFVTLGHDATFVDDLRAHITAFEQADDTKETGKQTQAGATEAFGPLLEEAMTVVRSSMPTSTTSTRPMPRRWANGTAPATSSDKINRKNLKLRRLQSRRPKQKS